MREKEKALAALLLEVTEHKPYKAGEAVKYSDDKQCLYYLEKWTKKGWWEYGVTLRSGWFTQEGIKHFEELEL
jgi:hypothetical protein